MADKQLIAADILGVSVIYEDDQLKIWNPNTSSGDTLTSDQLAQIEEAYNAAVSNEQATQYQRDRVDAYPSIGDQLDMIYRAGLGGDEFQAAIAAVKAAHPKPE